MDRKEYFKQYRKNNREKIKEYREKNKEYYKQYDKEYRENNKQKIKKYRENNKEYFKQYNKTDKRKKSNTISKWKQRGLKEYGYTYNELYEYYLSITNCEVCNKDLSTTIKCMDHDHITGCFRWVLCHSCNCHDNWINEIVRRP